MTIEKHPKSTWANAAHPPSAEDKIPAAVEAAGAEWRNADVSDDYLIGVATMQHGDTGAAVAAAIEMQRRAIKTQQRLIVAIDASGDCASRQTEEVIKLTRALKTYTIVLAIIGAIQIWLMWWKG
jgi:hypothetical protein